MDTAAAAQRWASTLRAAWPALDVDSFLALYAEEAHFRGPFSPPEPATEHMRRSLTLGEPGPAVWVGEPLVSGDRATVEWWAVIVISGEPVTFAATSWLHFGADGLVVDEHDYWQSKPGSFEPWPGWGVSSAA